MLDKGWWFIVRNDPRPKHIFDIFLRPHLVIMLSKEDKGDATKSNMYMFYLNIYIMDVSFYYCYLLLTNYVF